MPQDRDWVDYATLCALVAAFFAAASAAQQAQTLATETVEAIAHADGASERQHLDTLTALKIASDANTLSKETAARQARETASALALSNKPLTRLPRPLKTV